MTEVEAMGAQEDMTILRRGYEAFNAGDMDTFKEILAEDAVWRIGGTGGLSGEKRGRDAILGYFGELGSRSNGSIKVNVEDLALGDRYAIGIHTTHAQRDGKSLDQREILVFTISDGKIREALEFAMDSAELAHFWS
jgi:hypothetical protein